VIEPEPFAFHDGDGLVGYAGHLGAIEEFCGTTVHEPIDKARKCPFCGAAT
jgi:hypothetical protein